MVGYLVYMVGSVYGLALAGGAVEVNKLLPTWVWIPCSWAFFSKKWYLNFRRGVLEVFLLGGGIKCMLSRKLSDNQACLSFIPPTTFSSKHTLLFPKQIQPKIVEVSKTRSFVCFPSILGCANMVRDSTRNRSPEKTKGYHHIFVVAIWECCWLFTG